MHYKGFIITKELPTEERLAEILAKYEENLEESKEFEWDWWQIGGRYGGKLKIHFDPTETPENYYLYHTRNHKHFISRLLDDLKEKIPHFEELDYLTYMGLWEDTLYVDGAYYKDIIDFDITNCYLVIDDEENLYIRETWNGDNWIKHENFEEEVEEIDLNGKFITSIDFHD